MSKSFKVLWVFYDYFTSNAIWSMKMKVEYKIEGEIFNFEFSRILLLASELKKGGVMPVKGSVVEKFVGVL